MIRKNIFKGFVGGLLLAMLTSLNALVLTSCSDEPDSENFYTFTGEMMSDYLNNRPEYSDFAKICQKAGLMDLLSSYGHYTCFVPSNDAIQVYLQNRGISNVDNLSKADCDTIARTHLVNNIYTTFDMNFDRLPTPNLLGRFLATSSGFDNDSNAVIFLEGLAHIDFLLKDDSVENGVMQPIDMVIEKSNSYITDLIRDNPRLTTFYKALVATGVYNDVLLVQDPEWDPKSHDRHYYTSDIRKEVSWVPDTKSYGYTFFIEPDELLKEKYHIEKGDLKALYDLACTIYDKVYPEDANAPGHDFKNLTDSVNPLHRFVQYHILNKKVGGASQLTPTEFNLTGTNINGALGFFEDLANPCDWHTTLLPHTMIKVDQLTVSKYMGQGTARERYINRRYDDKYKYEGQHIDATVENPTHEAVNGNYFYVDDIVAFDEKVKWEVQNVRIRMDFSTVFPEIVGNNLRSVGNPLGDDDHDTPDDSSTPKNGRNFYFPLGYLDGVSFTNCYIILRRPHYEFWSWQGDEMHIHGQYDITFRLPPVPFSGEWQVRLGYPVTATRGIAQIYFDDIPQGIPIDMTKTLSSELYLGDATHFDANYYDDKMSDEEKAEEQKFLKNLGAYRAPRSIYFGNLTKTIDVANSIRRVVCQTNMDATKDHFLRFRVVSENKGNDNELILDYLELVPKTVYGIEGGDNAREDDL